MTLAQQIKKKALDLGFDLAGITDASPIDTQQVDSFITWLQQGCAGDMSYMHRNTEKRFDPAKLLPSARSVICVALNYTPPNEKTSAPEPTHPTGTVAAYARYQDYHTFIKQNLRKLAIFLTEIIDHPFKFKICVDSVPLAERALAHRAGLGFFGKNHMLINPILGGQIFLGEIITDLKLQTDQPIESTCHDCGRCIAACPTAALRTDGILDASKCINYLTIECKTDIPPEFQSKIQNRLFGCDQCVCVCPHQQTAPARKNTNFKYYRQREKINLQQLLILTLPDFKTQFADSPISRPSLDKLKSTAKINLKNQAK